MADSSIGELEPQQSSESRLPVVAPGLTSEDLAALQEAVQALEHPGFAARLAAIAGKPVELLGQMLPASASQLIATATTRGLEVALKAALRTMHGAPRPGSRLLHKTLATASGAAGGAFGLAALPVELPISTIIMLRSIGDVARSEGEDLTDPESALACLQVFALGTRDDETNAAESGYFAARGLLAKSVAEPRASSPNAGCSRKARRSWSGSLRKSHPALAW